MSSLPQLKQTNTHLGARPTRIGKARKLATGNTAMFRVKFTLTKLQEDVSKNGAETNCSASENYINKLQKKNKKKTQLLKFRSMEARQIDNQRPSKIIPN